MADRHASISAESLELMGKQAANLFLDTGLSLNEAVVKVASVHPNINPEQIKRVIEFANTATYLAKHDQNKNSGSDSSYPQFELADPGRVVQDMSDGARPTVVTKTDIDYGRQPLKKVSSVAADSLLEDMFKVDQLEPTYSKDTLIQEVMDTKSDLIQLKENLEHSAEKLAFDIESSIADYYDVMKNHLLDGGSFADVLAAARSTGMSQEKVAGVLHPFVVQLISDNVVPPQVLKMGADGLDKVAHRVVNTAHPLVQSFSAIMMLNDELEKVATGLESVEDQIGKVRSYIKENYGA
jgi:hypothetical protein